MSLLSFFFFFSTEFGSFKKVSTVEITQNWGSGLFYVFPRADFKTTTNWIRDIEHNINLNSKIQSDEMFTVSYTNEIRTSSKLYVKRADCAYHSRSPKQSAPTTSPLPSPLKKNHQTPSRIPGTNTTKYWEKKLALTDNVIVVTSSRPIDEADRRGDPAPQDQRDQGHEDREQQVVPHPRESRTTLTRGPVQSSLQ